MRARLLAVLTVSALCGACGDEGGGGGCGEAPQKEAPSAAGAPAGDYRGSGGGAAPQLITTQKGTRKVPEEYQRASQRAGPSSAADAPAKSTAPAPRPGLAAVRVVRRGVDGVAGRAEILCRVVASSPDGTCAASPDRDEIRRTCCPKGVIERCRVGLRGVELVGRGCVPDEAPASP